MAKHESLAYYEREYGKYEWGFIELFHDEDDSGNSIYYIVSDSGGSCNGPASFYGPGSAFIGPVGDFGELIEMVRDQDKETKELVYDAAKKNSDDMLVALRKELGLE